MDLKNPGTAVSLILAEIKSGTLPKTILIEGKDEASRKEAARICAAALLCEREEVPCAECNACTKVFGGRHPDVTVISPEHDKVSVDDIRKVRLDANISPFEAECKVVIFDAAHTLNVQSQNALLKILEEPPRSVYFILTAPSSKLLLPTVDSRCAKFSLGSLSAKDIYRSVCDFSGGLSENDNMRICSAVLYLDGFVPSEKSISALKNAIDICTDFYISGRFPFDRLPAKKEEASELQLILKVLSLCSLEVLKSKKGTPPSNGGILGKEALATAVMRTPLKASFTRYCFFTELAQRIDENANISALTASLRAGIYE